MAYILLIRHGQNEWVKTGRLAGWTPGVHLNDEGRQQAETTAGRLAELPIKAIYSSPLERCRETAAIIAAPHDLPVEELEAVGEVRYGEWEGAEVKELAKQKEWLAVQHFPSRFRFPQGESLYEVQARAVMALEQLNCQYEPRDMIVVCSHADLIKLVLAHYLGAHIDLFQRIGLAPASVSVLALHPNGPVHVERVNDSGPLQPPPEPEKKEDETDDTGS